LVGKSEGKKPLEEAGIDEGIILKWILDSARAWTGFIWFWVRTSGVLL
jgi:hypothetical protein